MTPLFWGIVSTAGLIFSLAVTWWVHSQYHLAVRVEPTAPPVMPAPLISVIVPARNEERNIAACLEGLLNQDYPNYEVIVVDDRSEDATPAILAKIAADLPKGGPRLIIIQGEPLPAGWAGKPHAAAQGAQAARGDWLCFIDADTFASPNMLTATLATAERTQVGLLTMMTEEKMLTFWEKVLQPLVFTALSVGFSPKRVNDPHRPDAVANGQYLLFRRTAYEAIGGHAAVAGSIVEDRDLSHKIKQAGLGLVFADGRGVASTRMYTNLAEIWEGWTKNIYLGLSGSPRLALLGVFGALISLLGALGFPAWIISAAVWLANGGGGVALLVLLEAVFAFTVLCIVRAVAAKEFHISPLYGLTLPIGAFIFAAMMITSTYNVLSSRGVTWKGRTYRTKA